MDIYYKDLRSVIADADEDVDTSELREAIDTFRTQAEQAVALQEQALSTGDDALLAVVNHKYRDFQRGFTSQGGLPGREFYQHVVFAPGLDTGK
jgi:N-acetylated-alpha-linked acidic dipeptidase